MFSSTLCRILNSIQALKRQGSEHVIERADFDVESVSMLGDAMWEYYKGFDVARGA